MSAWDPREGRGALATSGGERGGEGRFAPGDDQCFGRDDPAGGETREEWEILEAGAVTQAAIREREAPWRAPDRPGRFELVEGLVECGRDRAGAAVMQRADRQGKIDPAHRRQKRELEGSAQQGPFEQTPLEREHPIRLTAFREETSEAESTGGAEPGVYEGLRGAQYRRGRRFARRNQKVEPVSAIGAQEAVDLEIAGGRLRENEFEPSGFAKGPEEKPVGVSAPRLREGDPIGDLVRGFVEARGPREVAFSRGFGQGEARERAAVEGLPEEAGLPGERCSRQTLRALEQGPQPRHVQHEQGLSELRVLVGRTAATEQANRDRHAHESRSRSHEPTQNRLLAMQGIGKKPGDLELSDRGAPQRAGRGRAKRRPPRLPLAVGRPAVALRTPTDEREADPTLGARLAFSRGRFAAPRSVSAPGAGPEARRRISLRDVRFEKMCEVRLGRGLSARERGCPRPRYGRR